LFRIVCFAHWRSFKVIFVAFTMYNLRARVRAASVGAVRPQFEMRSQALPAVAASQVTPTQALEIIDNVTAVHETEVPIEQIDVTDEAIQPPMLNYMPDMPFMPVRDTPSDLGASVNLPAGIAADTAAILGPSVGAPVTGMVPSVDNVLSDRSETRAEVVSPPLLPEQHMMRDTGEANSSTLSR